MISIIGEAMTKNQGSYSAAGLATPANVITVTRIVASPVLFIIILNAEDNGGTSWAAFILGLAMLLTAGLLELPEA